MNNETRSAFPQAPETVWTATSKQLQAPATPRKKTRRPRTVDASFIAEERKARGMSAYELSKAAGLYFGTVARWEERGVIEKKYAERMRAWFAENPERPQAQATERPQTQAEAPETPLTAEQIRQARRIALEAFSEVSENWSEAKQAGYLLGVNAMEAALLCG